VAIGWRSGCKDIVFTLERCVEVSLVSASRLAGYTGAGGKNVGQLLVNFQTLQRL
jgi:ABC-type methionine transport system permease subunit